MTRILNVVGCKNAGKSRLVEILVPRMQKLGVTVGTLKHTEHNNFRWDREGTDTYRHHSAGSEVTGIFGRSSFAVDLNRVGLREPAVDEIIRLFYQELDLVVIEGCKSHPALKIEVCRVGFSDQALMLPLELLATYGNDLFRRSIPHFEYGQEDDLAQHILSCFDKLLKIPGT